MKLLINNNHKIVIICSLNIIFTDKLTSIMTYTIFYWIANELNNNEVCLIDGFCLRIEQIKTDVWWWCIYDDNSDEVCSSYSTDKWGVNSDEAKKLTENSYLSLIQNKVS